MSEDEVSELSSTQLSPEELLLQAARSGNLAVVKEILDADKECKTIDINCKGKQKTNHGWTPLHLASYFGHKDVAEMLIKYGAYMNVVNDDGDTPLHKAAYTGREDLVLLLLSNNADVFIKNGEGKTAKDFSTGDVKKLLKAVEEVDLQKREESFLNAAKDGDITAIKTFLQGSHLPNINCTDFLGNTALHCAAYRGQKEAVVLLLQSGIDSTIRNEHGQLAVDLANNEGMRQLLSLQPTRQMQKNAIRFEGPLMRKNRFLGWRPVWTVLEKGVMSFFTSRADASTGTKRKGYKYLDGCRIVKDENESSIFVCHFSDGTSQRFSVPFVHYQLVDRQKWINALTDHKEYATYYIKQGLEEDNSDDDDLHNVLPLGTLRDIIQTAQAQQQILETQVSIISKTWQGIINKPNQQNKIIYALEDPTFLSLFNQMKQTVESCHKMFTNLAQCMTVLSQQEEARMLQLKQEQERCRLLQQALHVLAQEHHDLEQSIVTPLHSAQNSILYSDTDCEEFYDACGDEDDDTLTPKAMSDGEVEDKTYTESEVFKSFPSSMMSVPSSPTISSKWGRDHLPVKMFSRNNFSIWSILKHCIGKELSKITMPIVFNEPLSFLQRISEMMEYYNLLHQADDIDDPVERIECVAAYAVSSLASNWERLGKPFNPVLGETYEFFKNDVGLKMVSEQVSHHPPISAFNAQSPHFCMYGSLQPKLKFWGKSVEIKPEGSITLELLRHKEIYTWSGVEYCVHNIIVGKMWLEQYGEMQITCHKTGLTAVLNFKPASWFSSNVHSVEGYIINNEKKKLRILYGKWLNYMKSASVESYDEYIKIHSKFIPPDLPDDLPKDKRSALLRRLSRIHSRSSSTDDSRILEEKVEGEENPESLKNIVSDLSDSKLLWKVDPRPDYSIDYYHFTLFAMALNELQNSLKNNLPPSDSRLRPDIRLLEDGNIDEAAFEKHRIEEKQREARKNRKKCNDTWKPRWFELGTNPHTGEKNCWLFKGKYWERDYSICPDIF